MYNFAGSLTTLVRSFRRNCQGSSSLINIVVAIPLVASAGVAIDYSRAARTKEKVQHVIDGAALAAAAGKNVHGETSSKKLAARVAIATKYLNEGLPGIADVEFLGTPTIGASPNTVDVLVNIRVKGSLVNILNALPEPDALVGGDSGGNRVGGRRRWDMDFAVSTKAGYLRESYICLLALNPTQKEAIYFQGNSEFMATCSVQANSNNAVAIKTWGNAYAQADSFCAVGGWSGSGFYPDPVGGCKTRKDPYAGLTLPAADSTCPAAFTDVKVKNETVNLTPGTYCGGIDVATHGVANLAAGLYIIKDGKLSVDSQSTLNAPDGVVFYLTGNSSIVDISSGATVKIVAPNNNTASESTTKYRGFAIMQDRATGQGNTNSIYSKGGVNITGGIYTPKQNLLVWANGDMNTELKYFPMIVDTLTMNGTATLFVQLDYSEVSLDDPILLKAPAKVFVSR